MTKPMDWNGINEWAIGRDAAHRLGLYGHQVQPVHDLTVDSLISRRPTIFEVTPYGPDTDTVLAKLTAAGIRFKLKHRTTFPDRLSVIYAQPDDVLAYAQKADDATSLSA